MLHAYFGAHLPVDWTITIVDNASTDTTRAVAHDLAERYPGVGVLGLDRKGPRPGAACRVEPQPRRCRGLPGRGPVHRARRAAAAARAAAQRALRPRDRLARSGVPPSRYQPGSDRCRRLPESACRPATPCRHCPLRSPGGWPTFLPTWPQRRQRGTSVPVGVHDPQADRRGGRRPVRCDRHVRPAPVRNRGADHASPAGARRGCGSRAPWLRGVADGILRTCREASGSLRRERGTRLARRPRLRNTHQSRASHRCPG